MRGVSPLESVMSDASTSWISPRSSVSRSQSRAQSPRLLLSTPARVSIQQPLALASTSTLVSPPPSYPGSVILPSPPLAPPTTAVFATNLPVPRYSPEATPGYRGDRSASIDSLVSESPEPAISTDTAGTFLLPVRPPAHTGSDTAIHHHFPGTICLCNQFESTPTKNSEKEQATYAKTQVEVEIREEGTLVEVAEEQAGARDKEEAEERAESEANERSKEKSKERVVKGKGKELPSHHETTDKDSAN
ncbi:hypothetical protein V565_257620, partial [Rhizoctonia solani 123E]